MLCDVEKPEEWRRLPGKRYSEYEVSDRGNVRLVRPVVPVVHRKFDSVRIGVGSHRKMFPIHELMTKVGF